MAALDNLNTVIENNDIDKMFLGVGALIGLFYGIKTKKSPIGIFICCFIGSTIGIGLSYLTNKK